MLCNIKLDKSDTGATTAWAIITEAGRVVSLHRTRHLARSNVGCRRVRICRCLVVVAVKRGGK
jgi:predicted RNase H-like nuclease (RuvC/YqgF family)